jgi:GT2 family glycosyltransferase
MTGLSVLIPIYNFDLRTLVKILHYQLSKEISDFEIRLYDDGSTEDFKAINKKTLLLKNLTYNELPKNIGRSAIRNLLAKDALYSHLLFLDCDNEIVKEDYISSFLQNIPGNDIIVGGRCYSPNPPQKKEYFLHWFVGSRKEVFDLKTRRKYPYDCFMLDNMLITKSLFLSIGLNEKITTYGHEDTQFGIELKRLGEPILHIDNPVRHIGLNTNKSFLEKTKLAIDNLYMLTIKENVGMETRLYKTYVLLKKYKLVSAFYFLMKKNEGRMYQNLMSSKPSLLLFDLYKLNYLVYKFEGLI